MLIQHEYFKSRSSFYNLDPIGIGTANVESLTSFIMRLCKVHHIRIRALFTYIYKQRLVSKPISFQSDYFNRGKMLYNQEITAALGKLTKRFDIAFLSLYLFPEYIYGRDVKKYRVWCPSCFEEDESSLALVYDRLLWNLEFVKICNVHKCLLETRCPGCSRKNPVLSVKLSIDFCHHCGYKLSNVVPKSIECLSIHERNAQEIIINQLCLLLSLNYKGRHFISFYKEEQCFGKLNREDISDIKKVFGMETMGYITKYFLENGIHNRTTHKNPGIKDMHYFWTRIFMFQILNKDLYDKLHNSALFIEL
ncbi:TniQ family protein [Priestia taiwanensis]|uniref:TniQ domain-containing protein n=1 Tax=Priestia taiwanensis TaxID=1347902 RepID=A0A917AX49_9BACI|nr:TniQ family protein [Priestia taiwanensis]MBM7364463.1 hypothetical protein [Priestia taiwanensis]GGE81275.1 hypothetical protein GCM10007140_33560 [Priestia taiwanensis]